jgi:hypothetical protein
MYASDNLVYRFTALLMWQEYCRARHDKVADRALLNTLEDITFALRVNMLDRVKRWQGYDRSNPLSYADSDFRKDAVTLFYAPDASEYMMTDRSPPAPECVDVLVQ